MIYLVYFPHFLFKMAKMHPFTCSSNSFFNAIWFVVDFLARSTFNFYFISSIIFLLWVRLWMWFSFWFNSLMFVFLLFIFFFSFLFFCNVSFVISARTWFLSFLVHEPKIYYNSQFHHSDPTALLLQEDRFFEVREVSNFQITLYISRGSCEHTR